MDDTKQYNDVCKGEFKAIKDAIAEMDRGHTEQWKQIHDKLFVGNGQPALMTRVALLEQHHKDRGIDISSEPRTNGGNGTFSFRGLKLSGQAATILAMFVGATVLLGGTIYLMNKAADDRMQRVLERVKAKTETVSVTNK